MVSYKGAKVDSQKFRIYYCLWIAALFIFGGGSDAQAAETARVAGIEKDASLKLDNGKKIQLAGVELPEESMPLLGILVGGKDVEIAADSKAGEPAADALIPAYLYVQTSEIELPFAQAVAAREKKIMINELLVAIGAARVLRNLDFEHKTAFIELEDKARLDGQGLWSYEVTPVDDGRSPSN